MFLKNVKIKSHTQLRNTERKALSDKLRSTFLNLTAQQLDTDVLPKSASVSVTKIENSSSKQVHVYVVNRTPLFFHLEDVLFPTIFFLWRYPDVIISFTTHQTVISKLILGADLMLPGVINPSPSCSEECSFVTGTLAYVNATINKAAYAVGVTAISSQDLANQRGKAVIIFHVYGDKLCSLEQSCPLVPELGYPNFLQIQKEQPVTVTNDATTLNVEQSTPSASTILPVTECNLTDEADRLLLHCFYAAIKESKNSVLPILISTFYKVNMLSRCPTNRILDLKKTSYKKLGNFLDKMAELKVVKIEETKKGVYNIVDIDFNHHLIAEFRADPEYTKIIETSEKVEQLSPPNVIESHSVTASVLPIFCNFGYSKGDVIENADVRKYITEYIKSLNLQDGVKKDYVILNPTLKTIFGPVSNMTFQNLIRETYLKMTPCFKIKCGNKEIFRKGKLETINISIAKRSGNKKVTLVDNIEYYGIDINELATHCQRGVAASATINRSPTSNKTDQLQIQGNQVLFIYNILIEKYKVPKRYIKGIEFAPKKKTK